MGFADGTFQPDETVTRAQMGSFLARAMSLAPVRWLMNTLPPNERVGKSILRQIGHGASIDAGRIPQEFFDWYLALQRHTDTMRNESEMIGRSGSLRDFPPELTMPDEVFAAVTTPTLFLWGEDDTFGGRDVAEHVVGLMPDARLEMRPDYASGHIVLGRCLLDKNDNEAAAQAFEHVLELDAENIIALKSLSEIAERRGDHAAARRWLDRLLDVDPMNDEARAALEMLVLEGVGEEIGRAHV